LGEGPTPPWERSSSEPANATAATAAFQERSRTRPGAKRPCAEAVDDANDRNVNTL
jgi:hypothetical protein